MQRRSVSLARNQPRSPRRVVGLSLESDRISAAEVRVRHGRAVLVKAAYEDLAPGVINDGGVTDMKAFTRAIKRLWRSGKFSTKKVSIAVREAQVLTRRAELPWMEPPDFAAALPYQVQDFLPVDTATVEVGFHVTDVIPADPAAGFSEARNQVVLVATSSDALSDHALALARAGLEPVHADSSAFALIRAVAGGNSPRVHEPRLLADLGIDHTTLVIEQDAQPELVRALPSIGLDTALATISSSMESPSQAKSVALRTGLNVPISETAPVAQSSIFATTLVTPNRSTAEVQRVAEHALSQWAGRIIGEIQDTRQYASQTGTSTNLITLTGIGSKIPGLADRIASELDVTCTVFDPRTSFDVKSKAAERFVDADGCAESLGLAYGNLS